MPEDKKEDDTKNKSKGKDEAAEAAPTITIDARVSWFEEPVCGALKIKNDKWRKLITVAEHV